MIQINLLPIREERRKADLRQLVVLLAISLLGSLGLVGAFHAKLRSDVQSEKTLLADTQRQIDQFKPQLEKVELYKKTKSQIEKKLGVIDTLDRSRSGPVRVLEELATHSPERLWLTRLQTRGNTIIMEGMSLDNELVALFMTALSESPYFQNVELKETAATQVDGLKLNQFKLTAALLTPAGNKARTAATGTGMPVGTGR